MYSYSLSQLLTKSASEGCRKSEEQLSLSSARSQSISFFRDCGRDENIFHCSFSRRLLLLISLRLLSPPPLPPIYQWNLLHRRQRRRRWPGTRTSRDLRAAAQYWRYRSADEFRFRNTVTGPCPSQRRCNVSVSVPLQTTFPWQRR